MVIYFADRKMTIHGMATTELMEGFTISDDLKTEDVDTGVAIFECTIHWDDDTRALAEDCTTAGNYILRSNEGENEFYTIIETENDTKNQSIYIYAEDAGMDLLNETFGAYEATSAQPISFYIEKYANDTGFEIGINEIPNLTRTLKWEGEATAAERIASVATEFDNAEVSYSFDIKGMEITHKYINIYKKRGKDAGYQLRLNRDVDRIVTTTSVADLATSLYVTGGTPEGSDTPINIKGYDYDDGDFYVMENESRLNCRSALEKWSRYVWAKEPNQQLGYTGNIIKQWSYDTTSVSELVNRAVSQLKKVSEPAVNYEIDINTLPENVGVGDYVDIVDEKDELYLNSRILKLTTSVVNKKQTATLGEFLIKEGGISETVKELAEQFSQLAKSRQFYTWIAYADDEYGDGISLDPTDKTYMGTATNMTTAEVDISDPSVFKWALIQGEGVGIEEIKTWYGVSDSPEVVPTEWREEPYEVLRNEYQWSYVEYDYTNGVVELTTPHIIAYYNYLEVDELDAKVANIESLLAGNAGVGELEAIYITSANAVIDQAVIVDALIGTVLADIIESNVIYTDQIMIMSEDGGIIISGSQIQVTTGQTIYYDENGNPRVQIGQDADGNFSLIIYDETGTGIMLDSEGIHESAIPDGLIVDSMVSDDAMIQGSKLDIASVAECLTEDGTLEVTAAQVTISDTTLDAWYTDVTQELEGLSGLTSEGLTKVEPWFCLWDSDVDVPPADEDLTPAICGEAICGLTICGVTDGILWKSEDMSVVDGLYKWVKWKGYYADGHTEWGDPYCLTDGYLRKETSVLQTELDVVSGEISARIWMSDINEAIETTVSDLWSEIDIALGSIELEVGSMSTTMGSLQTQVANIELTTDSITQTVYEIEQRIDDLNFDGVTNIVPYFCLWDSATQAPPEDGDLTPAICGQAICGLTICGVTDGVLWKTEEPADTKGLYKWVRYLLEYDDGHTEWSTPYCLTDDYVRDSITSVYSQIEQLADSITLEVGAIYSDLESNYASKASLVLQLDQSTGIATMSAEADVIQLSSGQLIINSGNFQLDEAGNIYAESGYVGDFTINSALYNGKSTFSSEEDGVYIGIDGISLGSGFSVTNSGTLTVTKGSVGGFTIGTSSIYNGKSSFSSTSSGVYIGTNGISLGSGFSVSSSGSLEATNGTIGGWTLGTNYLRGGSESAGTTCIMQLPATSSSDDRYWVFAAGGHSHSDHSDCVFRVGTNGEIYCYWIRTSGNLYAGASNSSTERGCVVQSSYGEIRIWVSEAGNRGLYDGTLSTWIIYRNSSGSTVTNTSIATVSVETEDEISELAAPNFRDPEHTLITHISSRTYDVGGKKHIGLTVGELEDAMNDAGMSPDDYDLTEHWEDEDDQAVAAIRYDELIPILIDEINALDSRIEALETA